MQTEKTGQTVTVNDDAYARATQSLETAKRNGEKFKATIAEIYRGIFQRADSIPVTGMEFNGIPYNVQVANSVLKKVINDKNISAEKLAVLENIPEIITNAEYVGSGEFDINKVKQERGKIRYDYFETDAVIGGKPYVVSFDVEVHPDVNNYRTHKVTEIELIPKSANRAAPAAAVLNSESVPTATVPQPTAKVNRNSSAGNDSLRTELGEYINEPVPGVKIWGDENSPAIDRAGNDLTTREGAAAAMAQRRAQEQEKLNNAGNYQNTAPEGTALHTLGVKIAGDQGDYFNAGTCSCFISPYFRFSIVFGSKIAYNIPAHKRKSISTIFFRRKIHVYQFQRTGSLCAVPKFQKAHRFGQRS